MSGGVKLVVEFLVEQQKLLEASPRDRARPPGEHLFDPPDDRLVAVAGGEAGIVSLEESPYLDGLARLLLGELEDRGAAAGGDRNEAFGGERADRLPDRVA